MLINYNGKYTDLTTVHEMGHTMQSYFSNKTQPYPLANYPFSSRKSRRRSTKRCSMTTCSGSSEPVARLALGNYPRASRARVPSDAVRGVQYKMQDGAEGPAADGTASRSYLDITRNYGHDQGVCIVDYIANEWSHIPLLRDLCVQYATSFTASAALEAKVKSGPRSRETLPRVSQRGGSKYPIDLLKDAAGHDHEQGSTSRWRG
jgi:oligoendopeptidase F